MKFNVGLEAILTIVSRLRKNCLGRNLKRLFNLFLWYKTGSIISESFLTDICLISLLLTP